MKPMIFGIALTMVTAATATAAEPANANFTRWAKGEYAYRTIKDQRLRGREDWTLTVHPDGSRTMASFVDNFDAGVGYNMMLRVDPAFRPIESFVAHWVGGALKASGHYVVDGDVLRSSVGVGPRRADAVDSVPPAFSLHAHPVAGDGWRGAWYDMTRRGVQTGPNFNLAVAPDAAKPLVGRLEDESVAWAASETITVPAGSFAVEHFIYRGNADIWIAMPDRIVVRYATPSADREYVLMNYRVGP